MTRIAFLFLLFFSLSAKGSEFGRVIVFAKLITDSEDKQLILNDKDLGEIFQILDNLDVVNSLDFIPTPEEVEKSKKSLEEAKLKGESPFDGILVEPAFIGELIVWSDVHSDQLIRDSYKIGLNGIFLDEFVSRKTGKKMKITLPVEIYQRFLDSSKDSRKNKKSLEGNK